MIERHQFEAIFRGAVSRCRPEESVRNAVRLQPLKPVTYGLALGDAAISMVRGAGPVLHGLAITRDDDHTRIPKGWSVVAHDETSEMQILDIIASADAEAELLVLVSGGAEKILTPALRAGRLAQLSAAPVRALVASNSDGDPAVRIGGASTIVARRGDFMNAVWQEIRLHVPSSENIGPATDTIERLAKKIVGESESYLWPHYWFGRPALTLPADHGAGGPAQQMALQLALELRGKDLSAFCAASNGWDGPATVGHPRPAGAFVDGTTWDAMNAAKLDPARALARFDAGPVLRAVGALVITHFTGIDHGGDIAIVG